MKIFSRCSGALIFLAAITIYAQTDKKSEEPKADFKIETIEARIPLRAWDAKGNRVTKLLPKDLVVVENGEGRAVTSVKFEPANILLVLDQSLEHGTYKNGRTARSSERDKIITQPAGWEFAKNIVSLLSETDQLALIQYSEKAELIQDWTSNRQSALDQLKIKFRQGHKARYYDALMLATETFKKAPSGRPILILLTDGTDSASETKKSEAFTALTQAGVTIYVINWTDLIKREIAKTKPKIVTGQNGVNNPTTDVEDKGAVAVSVNIAPWVWKRNKELKNYEKKITAGMKELTQLAEESGGEIYTPSNLDELIRQPIEIMKEIGAQYTITYLTEKNAREDALRAIELIARSGITVRARKNFYAAPAATTKESSNQ